MSQSPNEVLVWSIAVAENSTRRMDRRFRRGLEYRDRRLFCVQGDDRRRVSDDEFRGDVLEV